MIGGINHGTNPGACGNDRYNTNAENQKLFTHFLLPAISAGNQMRGVQKTGSRNKNRKDDISNGGEKKFFQIKNTDDKKKKVFNCASCCAIGVPASSGSMLMKAEAEVEAAVNFMTVFFSFSRTSMTGAYVSTDVAALRSKVAETIARSAKRMMRMVREFLGSFMRAHRSSHFLAAYMFLL